MARKKAVPKAPFACPSCGHRAPGAAGPLNFCPECGTDLRGGAAAASSAFLNKVIADRYRLLSLLGEGGMGSVYKAEHIRMGKALALKILRGDFASEQGAVERFRAEAQIVSRLSHPHTIAVFDFGEIEDEAGFYLAMEYVPGKDLAAVLKQSGRLPDLRVAQIGQQILGSLAEAHDAGIVHRDIKPGNVMLMQTRPGEDFAKVLDFGIAKLRDEGSAQPEGADDDAAGVSTTSAGAIVGTPNYLAPEQARGEVLDGRTDLYAVGCLLYELAAGRPPFQAPTPMAVVSAHLHQEPERLADAAPGVSRRLSDVVQRALAKRPEDRWPSADAMRDALLEITEPSGARRSGKPEGPSVTGDLEIARREDFREFDRQVRALRRSRVVAPLSLAAAILLAAAVVWRWADVYALLGARAPSIAALVPDSLRPSGRYDGEEHEPNDVPARANPLPIPPGPDGRPFGGVAVIRGHIGARLSSTTGDVDLFRIEVPPTAARKVLVAEWHGERTGEGIRGLDVALALNRERAGGDGRTSAPLVASVNRGGPGRPETLVAAVEPGVYYLAVREVHDEATGPVEKPTDAYVLEVRLADPRPGEEVEPNDAPSRVDTRFERYPEWREVGERNPLGEASRISGETAVDDPDVYAVAPRAPNEAPALVIAVPDPGLALTARLWSPDAEDLGAERPQDRVRFEAAGEAEAGEVLAVALPSVPRAGAPALVELRAADGHGHYDIVALGDGDASAVVVIGLAGALAEKGRAAAALEVAAAYASGRPGAVARTEVLAKADRIAAEAAAKVAPDEVSRFDRASRLLGAEVFRVEGGKIVYRGAFGAAAQATPRPRPSP